MTTLLPVTCQRTAAFGILAAFLFAGAGCKPSPPPNTGQATPPADSAAPRQPTTDDLRAFFASMLPADIKVLEVKMDAPAPMPNTSPAQNIWLLNVKTTLTPTEDLFSLPSSQDTQPIDSLVSELNRLVEWRNTYVASPYAKACGGLEIKVPASPMPQMLVVAQPKNQPLAPIYGRMSAEWQVDHWQFVNVNTNIPKYGDLRSFYQGATMVKGSPEAEQAVGDVRDAVAQARKDIEAIRSRYAEQVIQGTKPGTAYRGRVSFRQDVLPCELRFLDPPPGGDARFSIFELALPSANPPCTFTYSARVTTVLPIPVPGAQPAAANPYAVTGFNDGSQVPDHNVYPKRVGNTGGKLNGRTLPDYIYTGSNGSTIGMELLLLDGHLDGPIAGIAEGVRLSVQQTPSR